jgi:hypothetical protein
MALGLMMITLTGHLGGILSGVESPSMPGNRTLKSEQSYFKYLSNHPTV